MNTLKALKHRLLKTKNAALYRLAHGPREQKDISDAYHRLIYDAGAVGKTWSAATWFGVPCRKLPFDLWAYQEIVTKLKPDLIIETGTFKGGSALYLAHLCDLVGKGTVITIDTVEQQNRPQHARITYVAGSSTDPKVVEQIRARAKAAHTVLVILDSDHSARHVALELELYSPLVTKGSYIIVEDTNVNGHPVFVEHGPGPHEALDQFLAHNKKFVSDTLLEKFFVSFNADGYLKRTA